MAHHPVSPAAVRAAAEDILQAVYGDDLNGCAVRIDTIAEIISHAVGNTDATQAEMLSLYERAVEALNLLATPPPSVAGLAPEALPRLLSERLDAIRDLTQKLISTAAAARTQASATEPTP